MTGMARRDFIEVAVILCLILAPGALPGVAHASDAAAVENPTGSEVNAIHLRQDLGFKSALDYVRAVAASPDASDTDSGILLTPLEDKEFLRRRALGERILVIDKTYANDPTYAGAWMDQLAGGVLNVAFTHPLDEISTAVLDELLPPGEVANTTVVARSMRDLASREADLTQEMISQKEPIVSAGVDLAANDIVVTILAEAPAATEAELLKEYGAAVTLERGSYSVPAVSRDIRTGLLYGGEWILGSNGHLCTDTYTDARSTTNQVYSLTAGHCGPNGTTFVQGRGGTRGVGAVHANGTFGHSNTQCDCAPVGATPVGFQTNKVLINNNSTRTFTQATFTYQGEPMCQSGAASYEATATIQCGVVTFNDTTTTERNSELSFVLWDCFATDAHIQSGDGGGPAIDGNSFIGLVSGGPAGGPSYYSRSVNVFVVALTLSFS